MLLVYKGNRNFENKKYDDVSAKYLDAIKRIHKTLQPIIIWEIHCKQTKMYKEAHAEYKRLRS